jgi:hypothetical protein
MNRLTHIIKTFLLISLISIFSCTGEQNNENAQKIKTDQTRNNDSSAKALPAYPPTKVNYSIYIENSGSMDGYVAGITEFEQSVYSLISDIRIADYTDSLNLNYINSQVIDWKKNAQDPEIVDFIEKLEPTTFRGKVGDRSHSDLQNVFKQVLNKTTPNTVSVIVSDCIFSPGKSRDAQNYLVTQQIGFKTAFDKKLDSFDFSTLIMQFTSKFTGYYYDKTDNPTFVNGQQRPFYITILGAPEFLDQFLTQIKLEKRYREIGYKDCYLLSNPKALKIEAKIIRNNAIGEFDIEMPANKLTINNAQTGGKSKTDKVLQFSIAASLSKYRIDSKYLEDSTNYELPPNYKISGINKNTDETNESLKGFSHIFTISTRDIKQTQKVEIKLKNQIPAWVSEHSSLDDSNILNPSELSKTFGLHFLLKGMAEAYENKSQGKEQFSIPITVNRNSSQNADNGSGNGILLFILAVLFIVVIIILKRKK